MKKILLLLAFLGSLSQYINAQNQPPQDLSYTELNDIIHTHYVNREYDDAIRYTEVTLKKAQLEFGQMDTIVASCITNLCIFYREKGQLSKACPFCIEALDLRRKVLGEQHPDFSFSLNCLANLYQRMGDYDKALVLYHQVIENRAKFLGKEHPKYAVSIGNLSKLYQTMGLYSKALPFSKETIAIFEKSYGKKHPKYATSLAILGILYLRMEKLDQALPLYKQAATIYEKALGKNHPHVATMLNNIAVIYKMQKDYDKALDLYLKALHIRENTLGKNHPDIAQSLANLSNLYERNGNIEKALISNQQALKIREKVFGKEHTLVASSISSIARLHKRMGRYDQALTLTLQTIAIRKKALGAKHPQLAQSLISLAEIQQQLEKYDQAWLYYLQALLISSNLTLSKNIAPAWTDRLLHANYSSNFHLRTTIQTLREISSLLKVDPSIENALDKQVLVADLALQLITQLRNELPNEQDKLRLLEQSSYWVSQNLNVLNLENDAPKAFQLADQNKSVLLLQSTKSETIYRLGNLPDSLVRQDKKLHKAQSKLQAKLLEKRSDVEKNQLRSKLITIEQKLDSFDLMIKTNYPQYYQLKYQKIETKASDIQQQLDDQTALLEFVLADSVIHIFYLDKQTVEWSKTFVATKNLNYRIKSLHQALSDYEFIVHQKDKAYKKYTEQAYWFYQKLLAPTLKDKANISHLVIITDGKLGHLPFETFLVERPAQGSSDYNKLHYLVNDYNISYNYSAALWKDNARAATPKNNGKMLAMAANYTPVDSSIMSRRLPSDQWLRELLQPLPAARKEVEALEKEFDGCFAFDSLATEKMVKEKAPDYAIIHLAMHGILNEKKPILSSLAFTEDGDSLESNFWQAHEISKLHLNANLVVLSACETGFGKFEQGNGIASLARSFMYAGASSLIVSLWQVNDFATSEIMQNLYHNLDAGMKKDAALRQAKLQYVASNKGMMAHPAFWSPFIQIGNTNAISIAKKGSMTPWLIGLGLLFLAGGGLFFRRRTQF